MTTNRLTGKQKELLLLLYRFRFLTISHLKLLFNHSDSKRIRLWLKDLQQKGLIQKKRIEGITNQEAYVYFLTVECRSVLDEMDGITAKGLNEIKREPERTDEFIQQCLFIANVYLRFCTVVGSAKLLFFTKRDIFKFSYFFKPYPDAYIAIEQNGKVIKRYFLDIFDLNAKRSKYRKRIEKYIEYFVSNEWEENTKHPFPSILLISPNKDMKDYCYRVIKAIQEDEGADISFFLATKKAVQLHGVGKDTWQEVK